MALLFCNISYQNDPSVQVIKLYNKNITNFVRRPTYHLLRIKMNVYYFKIT